MCDYCMFWKFTTVNSLMSGVNRKVNIRLIAGSGGEYPEFADVFLVKCIYLVQKPWYEPPHHDRS